MKNIKIIDAHPEDSAVIAEALCMAIGMDLVKYMAGNYSTENVIDIFRHLAEKDNTQYSYKNTRLAVTSDGDIAGVCISYDGGRLKELRKTFFNEAILNLNWTMSDEDMDSFPCETDKNEFYLDTLATFPKYRNQGVATALIRDAYRKASEVNLPLGLLVADNNDRAQRLYLSVGFKPVGRRLFAGEEMTNMRM